MNAPSTLTKLLKTELLNIKSAFPKKFKDHSQSGTLSHSRNDNASYTIHSDLQILDQTWLGVPPENTNTGLAGDWSSTENLPNFRFGISVLPKEARLEHGDPPLDLPFEYSDARTQKFFNGDSWFKRGKIKLPSCFEYDSTYGGNLVSRVALSEGLAKRALKSAHGIFDLNSDMGFMLNELEESNFHNVDWKLQFVNIRNLLNTNALALRRIILYASSCVMVNKSMAREIVLPRFVGKDQLVDALRHSDFGTPDLFGPLNAEMEENVRMYRTHNNKEWRMTVRRSFTATKRKASSSLSSPPLKKGVSSSPLTTSASSGALQQGSQNQYGKGGVFQKVRGNSKKRRGRGQRGRGK